MAVNRQNTDISAKIDILIIIRGIIQLGSPFLGMAAIMSFIMFQQNLDIIMHTNDYKISEIYLDSISCIGAYSSASLSELCDGFGKVKGIQTFVDLGNDFEVDFNRKTYPVFYRPDGKLTLLRKEEEMVFNNRQYLKTALLQLGLPLLIMILLFIYYKVLTKKIKRYEQEKNNSAYT